MSNALNWIYNTMPKSKASRTVLAWKEVFNMEDENVRLIIEDLMLYCSFIQSSFVPNDELSTVFNEGGRDVFLHILEMLNLDMGQVLSMINVKGV